MSTDKLQGVDDSVQRLGMGSRQDEKKNMQTNSQTTCTPCRFACMQGVANTVDATQPCNFVLETTAVLSALQVTSTWYVIVAAGTGIWIARTRISSIRTSSFNSIQICDTSRSIQQKGP